ncbi:curlin, partial [Pseudomonas frederiksbergensis]|nr:curlin [Pseudomonas frederiksbergensis]
AEQLFENGSKITQRAGGSYNDAFASQSVGLNNESLQTQQGVGNKSTVWQDTQEGSKATTWQSGQRNEAFIEQTFGGTNNRSTVNQTGQDNYA